MSPVWLAALKSVNPDTALIFAHPDRTLFKGYALPDPAIFTSPDAKQDRIQKNFIAWLLIRPAWITYTTSRQSKAESAMPQAANWKAFLAKLSKRFGFDGQSAVQSAPSSNVRSRGFAGSHGAPPRGGQPAPKVRKIQRSGNVTQYDIDDTFSQNLKSALVDVSWEGDIVKPRDAVERGCLELPPVILREVMWELYEQNFRLELLALERCIVSGVDMSLESRTAREDMVSNVFPDGRIVMYRLPTRDEGLGAQAWTARVRYVEAFRLLLELWPGSPSSALRPLVEPGQDGEASEALVRTVEGALYKFYCQTFFQYFGRAATIPCPRP